MNAEFGLKRACYFLCAQPYYSSALPMNHAARSLGLNFKSSALVGSGALTDNEKSEQNNALHLRVMRPYAVTYKNIPSNDVLC